jgi:hypothetical protein
MKQNNIDTLTTLEKHFFEYVKICNKTYRLHTPSKYLYRKIIEAHKSVDYQVSRLLPNVDFLELVYVTLDSWGMNTRSAKLVDFNSFEASIPQFQNRLIQLEGKELQKLTSHELDEVLRLVKPVFTDLKVMETKPKLVGLSKTLHFLLPKLFPPMDRSYTLKFFREKVSKSVDEQFITFSKIFHEFYNITKKLNLVSKDVDGDQWNTTIPKLIDNAIIGSIKKKKQ